MIELKNVSFRYAGQRQMVLSQFDMELAPNRIYGLLGKNGMGKSTLLYLIAGLLRPKAGTVTVDGHSAARREPEMLRELFIVPEEFDLPPIPLETYLRLYAPFYPRFSREVLYRCLQEFDLEPGLHLGRLSMGQKKKVYMSVALAAGTRLLLMDEPTNGLDIPSKSQFRRVMAGTMTDDRTVIISTHQVHDVEQLLDHLLVIGSDGLLLNAAVSDITDRYAFRLRMPGDGDSDAIYAEPTLQGNATIVRRQPGDEETPINLELLFNAVTSGKLRMLSVE